MVDRVRPLKLEDPQSGGTETDAFPESLNHNEDYVDSRGTVYQNDSSDDELVAVSRDASDNLTFKDDVVSGTKTLSDLLGVVGDQAAAQARRTTTLGTTTSWADVLFDATDIENDTSVVEHDNTNTDRILLKETGPYRITYHMRLQAPALADNLEVEARIRVDDTTVIPGSEDILSIFADSSLPGNDHVDSMSGSFVYPATAGEFLTLQVQHTVIGGSGPGTIATNMTFSAVRMTGERGSQGPAGASGTNAIKDICRVATTANISLSGEQTIDGVLTSADRVLVKDQSTGSQNGIYVSASGAWARAADFNESSEVDGGLLVPVSEGTANGNSVWQLTTNDPITIDTTVLAFAELTGAGGGTPSDNPSVQIRRSTAFTPGTTWGDVDFNTTDIQNDASTVEYEPITPDDIVLHEAGLYKIEYFTRIQPPASANSNHEVEARVRVNDTTVLDGSESIVGVFDDAQISGSTHADSISGSFLYIATAEDAITLQMQRTLIGGGGTISTDVDMTFTAIRMTGQTGPAGADGADGADGDDGAPGPSGPSNAFKDPVRAATTGSITLSGLQTVDGVSLAVNDRVLVKNQGTGSDNGIYNAKTTGWTRSTDYDDDAEVIGGQVITVSEGTANGNSLWQLTTDDPITVGTTALVYEEKVGGAGGGNQLDFFDANTALLPSTNKAELKSRNGHPIVAFDDTVDESAFWARRISQDYSGGNVIVDIDWVAETATTGNTVLGIQVERLAPGGQDIDTDGYATQKLSSAVATNATNGVITRTTITLSNSEADSIAAGDLARIRIEAKPTDGGWTMTGDLEIVGVNVRQ
jgi:hypothetical protein